MDFSLPVRSDSLQNSAFRKSDHRNMGVGVGYLLLSCLQADENWNPVGVFVNHEYTLGTRELKTLSYDSTLKHRHINV